MPIRLVEVDLGRDVPSLPPISARYDGVRVLVRLHRRALGCIDVRNDPGELEALQLRRTISSELAGPLWTELRFNGNLGGIRDSDGNGHPSLHAISVIVCTRNRPGILEGCLAALETQTYPLYEVIVVDNAPTDGGTRAVAEQFGVGYVVEARPGLDFARNCGLAAATAPIVAYTDDDARPDPAWLEALSNAFSSGDVGAVTGPVLPEELETSAQVLFEDVYGGMTRGFSTRIHSRRGKTLTYRPTTYGCGANMAFRRDTLEQVGGFDPALDTGTPTGGGGDQDILQRVIEHNAAIVYCGDALVRHIHRRTHRELRRQLFDNGRGYSAVLCAALLRARGVDRLRVVYAFVTWVLSWHVRRVARRLLGRERLPLHLVALEFVGAFVGPLVYAVSRRRARRIAEANA